MVLIMVFFELVEALKKKQVIFPTKLSSLFHRLFIMVRDALWERNHLV